jgi:CheY-like chemotaxis protein
MMRILWVEDDVNVARNQPILFGDFLKSHGFKHISDFSLADSEISDKLYKYDLIILDINLNNSSEDERITELAKKFELSNTAFLEEAGFHLYLNLLKQGFPQTQVIFMTGNVNTKGARAGEIQRFKKAINESTDAKKQQQAAQELARLMSDDEPDEFYQVLRRGVRTQIFQWVDEWGKEPTEIFDGETVKNTYEIFEQRFKEARLIPPGAIDKKQDCSTNLKNWLGSHCERNIDKDKGLNYDYLTLRRGILNVVTEIKDDSAIELNPTFQELDKTTFLEGLTCHLREFSLPKTKYCQLLYSILCEYLTKPFQEAYKGKGLTQDENVENRHLKLPLYNLRNWIVHGLLVGSNTRLSAQEVGITFLLAMKGIFNVEKYGYCEELKQLFDTSSITRQQLIDQIKMLSRREKYYAARRKKQTSFDVIHYKTNKGLNGNWPQENYIRHFYATYLFSIQHLDSYELCDQLRHKTQL